MKKSCVQTVLACTLQRFDVVPLEDRLRLFGPEFADLIDEPVSVDSLAPVVADELIQRASLAAFGDADCLPNERPGRPRQTDVIIDGEIPFFDNLIWRINDLRTASFRPQPGEPPFTAAALTPEEVEQQCSVDDQGQLNCQIQTTNCPGQSLDGVCLRVPPVAAGDSVRLEGINFLDVGARVVLRAKPPGMIVREIDAHVCGDITTPVTEIVDGRERVIVDSRVKDKLSFIVPTELPDGIYFVNVVVPNTANPDVSSSEFGTRIQPLIRVIPASTATFQIASEELFCREETDGFGSDEVGIRIQTIPIGLDFSLGEMRVENFR